MKQLIEVVPIEKTYRRGLMLYHMMMETFENMTTVKELTQAYSKVDSSLELMNGQAQSEKALGRIKEVRFYLFRFFEGISYLRVGCKIQMLIREFNFFLS